jgi:Holliday junction resolvase
VAKSQRDKGLRREREIVNKLREHGIKAERVPLSGAAKFRNTEKTDVDVYAYGDDFAPWISEVKGRGGGQGFVTIEKWLGDADALFLIRDRAKPLVVLPWERLIDVLLALRGRMR